MFHKKVFIFHLTYYYRTLGTPTDETWPGVVSLPEFKSSFPRWKQSNDLSSLLNDRMRDDALDLLLVRSNILSLSFSYSFFYLYRKCSSTIRYDVYRLNNVLIILISNNSIHKIYLYRLPLLYLLSKKEPSDIKYVCVNCYVRYFFFLFLIDICSYISLKSCSSFLFYIFYIVHITIDLSVHFLFSSTIDCAHKLFLIRCVD